MYARARRQVPHSPPHSCTIREGELTDQQAVAAAEIDEALPALALEPAPVVLPQQQQVRRDRHVLVDELQRVCVLRPDLNRWTKESAPVKCRNLP